MASLFDGLIPANNTPAGAGINWLGSMLAHLNPQTAWNNVQAQNATQVDPNPIHGPAMPAQMDGPVQGPPVPSGWAAGAATGAAQQAQANAQAQNAGGGPGEPPARGAVPSSAGSAAQAGPPVRPGGGIASTRQQTGGDPAGAAMARYPSSNPQFALQSALLDMGINPFRANPMMGMMMRNAPGLAQAFLMQNLNASPSAVTDAGGEGSMFGNYLRSVLGAQNGMGSALANAQRNLPGMFGQLRGIQDQIANNGMSMDSLNPFAQALMTIWDDPQGAAGAYGALTTPFMSQGTGQSFTRGLTNVAGMAQRQAAADYGQSIGSVDKNFWDYLFPNL